MAPHKRLRGGVEFVKSIPKSPSGKILRQKIIAEQLSKRPLPTSKLWNLHCKRVTEFHVMFKVISTSILYLYNNIRPIFTLHFAYRKEGEMHFHYWVRSSCVVIVPLPHNCVRFCCIKIKLFMFVICALCILYAKIPWSNCWY